MQRTRRKPKSIAGRTVSNRRYPHLLTSEGPSGAFLFVVRPAEHTCSAANLASHGQWGTAMADKFFAELITSSEFDGAGERLEITVSNSTGGSQTLSLGPDALAALAEIVLERAAPHSRERLTKIPKRYAVGHGRHEPFVMLRFEDEPAYGLSASQAADLAEALLEEAETVADTRYAMRQ